MTGLHFRGLVFLLSAQLCVAAYASADGRRMPTGKASLAQAAVEKSCEAQLTHFQLAHSSGILSGYLKTLFGRFKNGHVVLAWSEEADADQLLRRLEQDEVGSPVNSVPTVPRPEFTGVPTYFSVAVTGDVEPFDASLRPYHASLAGRFKLVNTAATGLAGTYELTAEFPMTDGQMEAQMALIVIALRATPYVSSITMVYPIDPTASKPANHEEKFAAVLDALTRLGHVPAELLSQIVAPTLNQFVDLPNLQLENDSLQIFAQVVGYNQGEMVQDLTEATSLKIFYSLHLHPWQ